MRQTTWNVHEGHYVWIPIEVDGGSFGPPVVVITKNDGQKITTVTNDTDPDRIIIYESRNGK